MRETLIDFYTYWHEWIGIVVILAATLAVALVVRFLLRKLRTKPDSNESFWRDVVFEALNVPLRGMVWVTGLSIVEDRLTAEGHWPVFAEVFPPLRDIVVVCIAAWFLLRLTHGVTDYLVRSAKTQYKEFDETAADAVGKVITAAIAIIATLVIMQTLGFSLASLLAFGGVAGIALGFAAQGLVSNLLGGITIYASRPFKVGDHVVFSGGSLQGAAGYIGWQAGEVQHIGWRATRILDWNGKPFYVPNAKFNTETVINHSRMLYREISEYVYIRLEDVDKVAGITEDVNRMLANHAKMGSYFVFQLDGFGEYALKLYLYAYTSGLITSYTDYLPVKQDVLLKIAAIIAEHGAKLAVPVSTVYLPNGDRWQYDRQLVPERPPQRRMGADGSPREIRQ